MIFGIDAERPIREEANEPRDFGVSGACGISPALWENAAGAMNWATPWLLGFLAFQSIVGTRSTHQSAVFKTRHH
jgi:hypothetical protein